MTDTPPQEIAPFQVGDVVYLASGSPALTIMAIDNQVATCSWFLFPDQHRYTAAFPLSALRYRLYEKSSSQPRPTNGWITISDEPESKADRAR